MKSREIPLAASIGLLAIVLSLVGTGAVWPGVFAASPVELARAPATTIVVNSTADSGPGTLGQALLDAGIALTNGGNRHLAAPRINDANLLDGVVTGTACANCTVEVFSADDEEGHLYEGTTTADGAGELRFEKGAALDGPNVTATATDAAGNTPPFSPLFEILWVDLGPDHSREALERLGLTYHRVAVGDFGSADLSGYDVLFVGSTSARVPDDVFQPLLDRKADIDAFVQAGGALVALSDGGDWRQYATSPDWSWVPVSLNVDPTAQTRRTHIIAPDHALVERLTDANFNFWWGAHGEPFVGWDWPAATSVVQASDVGRSALLAGPYGAGRMVLTGTFPDVNDSGDRALGALLHWAAGRWPDTPPQALAVYPEGWGATGTRLRLTFDQLVDPATVTPGVLTVVADSGPVTGTMEFSPDIAQIFFTPAATLVPGEGVTATLSAAVTDRKGNPLDGDHDGTGGDDYLWRFTVRAGEILLVSSTDNEGPGTLRQALEDALPGDTIRFDPGTFPPGSPATIQPEWDLPEMQAGYVTVDASDSGVVLDFSRLNWAGLVVHSDGNVLQGLTLVNAPAHGLYIADGASHNLIGGDRTIGAGPNGQGNTIANHGEAGILVQQTTLGNAFLGNHVGTDPTGTQAWPNGQNWGAPGLQVAQGSDYTVIGSGLPGERNLFSGNRGDGLDISESAHVTITGNYVGTDYSGLVALGNGGQGLRLDGGSRHAVVEDNVFGGNLWGAAAGGPGTAFNAFTGNSFGLDATGTAPLPNQRWGLVLYDRVQETWVEDNVLAAGAWGGIYLGGVNNVIRGNYIGTDAAGTADWGFGAAGIYVEGYRDETRSQDSYDNRIEGNVIAHNGQGVIVHRWEGTRVDGNVLRSNHIWDSRGADATGPWLDEGISLVGGANNSIMPPVITAVDAGAGTASGTACAKCVVEVFSGDDDEGRWWEGFASASASGDWSFKKGSAFTGPNVHSTNTDGSGNTSEFSGPPPLVGSVSPTSTVTGTLDLGVAVYGDGFRDNDPLAVAFGAGVSVASIEFISRTQLYVYLDVDPGATLGFRDLTVTNYDGQRGTLVDAFEIGPVPRPLPTVTAVSPYRVAPDVGGELRIHGQRFINRPQVAFSGDGITVDWVRFDDPSRLTVGVTVSDTASLGARDVTVTNPDGQSDTLLGALEVVAPHFDEVAAAAGVDDRADTWGVAWADYDGDGDQDLFAANSNDSSRLYENGGGLAFVDVAVAAGVARAAGPPAIAWADYDNDGHLDAVLVGDHHEDDRYLYHNNGDGTFSEVAVAMGLAFSGKPEGLAWADYDRDGDVDLFVGVVDQPSVLFRNEGGSFTEVGAAAGVSASIMGASGVAWGDYNGDNWPDLFVPTYDYALYHNNGDGTFTEVGAAAGINIGGGAASPAWADYDNDGDLDLFVCTITGGEPDRLFRNNGDGTFWEVASQAGVDQAVSGRGVAWGDYDNDGYLDLYVGDPDNPDRLYHNGADGTFSNGGLAARLGDGWSASGAAWGDYDGDGFLDLYVGAQSGPNLLYHNTLASGGNHWLHVRLLGTLSNVRGIGARVRVVAGGLSQVREVSGGSGFHSQNSLPVEFGFGGYAGPVTVEVTWPSGVVDTVPGVAVDQVIQVTESTPYVRDMAMVSVAPDGEWDIDVPLAPVATLRNLGHVAENVVPASCEITHHGGQVYLETLATGLVRPARWTSLTYPAYTPPGTGVYTITCSSRLAGDQRLANDSLARTITVTQQTADVWTKDHPGDQGDVPSGSNNWYMSPDLWLRNSPDGGLVPQDPIAGLTNTVYVRLRNRGNTPIYSGTVRVYWIEPSLGVRCGDWAFIDEIPFANLMPGEVRIVSTEWVPTRTGHTCLQGVVDSPQDPYDRGLECSPQWVRVDNNVEWHNVNIMPNPDGGLLGLVDVKEAQVQLVNLYNQPYDVDMIVDRLTFPTEGSIAVLLPEDLFDRWWTYGGRWGEGMEVLPASKEIRVTGEVSATIGAIPMLAEEAATVRLRFEGPAGLAFEVAIRERIDGITTGGVAYQWVIPDTTPPGVVATLPVDGAEDVPWDSPLVITFTEEMGPGSLDLVLEPDSGGWWLSWNEAGTVVTATPGILAAGTTYTATVMANDAAGNPLLDNLPVNWTFTTTGAQMALYAGWTLRAPNVQTAPPTMAEEALDDIEAQGGFASEIYRWLSTADTWNGHVKDLSFNNFELVLGQGYFFKATVSSTWRRVGVPPAVPVPVQLNPVWTLIGVPKLPGPMKAESLLQEATAQGGDCAEIYRWNTALGSWQGHVRGLPFNNFDIVNYEGYFLRCSRATTYVPGGGGWLPLDWPKPASLRSPEPQADPAIDDVLVTNLRDVAFTVTWRTDRPSHGWLEFLDGSGATQVVHDESGPEAVSTLHQVTAGGLMPETTYVFRVHAGERVADDDGAPYWVTTAATAPNLLLPFLAYGRVETAAGSPAPGALVLAWLRDGAGKRSGPYSAVVDGWGYWSLNLPLADCGGLQLELAAYGRGGGVTRLTYPACQARPAPVIGLAGEQEPAVYLPLVVRQGGAH